MNQLAEYLNGNCKTIIYNNGTKERYVLSNEIPNPKFPENMDIKITNWCDAGCSWCHEASHINGNHANLKNTINLLKGLPPGVEVAIGGGNPLAHPEFESFIKTLTYDIGLICNVTINEVHFDDYKSQLEYYINNNLIKGIGYSYLNNPCTWDYEHLVSHIIIGISNFNEIEKITKINKKILLLGYKNFRKGLIYNNNNFDLVNNNIQSWKDNLHLLTKYCQVSFDNLAIEQTNPERLFMNKTHYNQNFMGEEGQFSMYIDAVKQQVAKASFEKERKNYIETDIIKTFQQIATKIN